MQLLQSDYIADLGVGQERTCTGRLTLALESTSLLVIIVILVLV